MLALRNGHATRSAAALNQQQPVAHNKQFYWLQQEIIYNVTSETHPQKRHYRPGPRAAYGKFNSHKPRAKKSLKIF